MGDHYTMGPDTAAIAARMARRAQVVADALGHVPAAQRHADALRKRSASRCEGERD
jgi:hypothetical protein